MKTLLEFCGVLALLPAVALAQVCDVSMSYDECEAALEGEAAVAAELAGNAAEAEVDRVNTGSQSMGDGATQDFNPRFHASVDALGENAADSGGSGLTLSWNDLLQSFLRNRFFGNDGQTESSGQHHKLFVKLQEAELFEPLEAALADAAAVDELQSSLGDFDDVVISFRLSLNSQRFGRDLQTRSGFVDAIQTASLENVDDAAAFRLGDVEDRIIEGISAFDQTRPLNQITDDATARQLIAAMAEARSAHLGFEAEYQTAMRANGFLDLVKLVNNQPQIVLAIESRQRDDLVGPDRTSLKFSYEFGGVNVSTYERYRGNNCQANNAAFASLAVVPARAEIDCLTRFTAANRQAVDEGNRFAASLEYVDQASYDFSQPGLALSLPSQRSFVASLAYGRYLKLGSRATDLTGVSRVDVTASYEDVGDDPSRQDRALAKVLYSQGFSDGMFLELGFVWASKPEFRGDVDEELSARAGISYKLAKRQ